MNVCSGMEYVMSTMRVSFVDDDIGALDIFLDT